MDDASNDGTLAWLQATAKVDPRLKYISFSRNFGHQTAVTAGLQHASGNVVVIMDADLQDPPRIIVNMFQRWCEGFEL